MPPPSPSHKWEGDSAYDPHALHGFAHDSIARGSKSFALASQLFDRETRERVWLLYAWCRAADDLTDGQDHGGAMKPGHDPAAAVAHIRAQTDKAFAGEPTGDMEFDALGFLLTEVAIPRAIIDDIIAGFELHAKDWRPRSEDDLLRYSRSEEHTSQLQSLMRNSNA